MAKLSCLISFSCYAFFLMIITLDSLTLSHSETPNYLKFVSNASTFPSEDYYDYIIVGGGTTGCPLAATLSEKYKVLVLERGGVPYGRPNVMNEDRFLALFNEVHSYDSPVQPFITEDGVFNARGRVLGGSSAINLGFYTRADQEFFETSGMQWDFGLVNQSYEWVEKDIVFEPELKKWQTDFRDALLYAGVEPYHGFTLDHVIGTKISGSTFDRAGKRHCAADLLSNANPENILVAVYASAERIILDETNQAAIGVEFSDEVGSFHLAMLRDKGEILISAGALGSPQLLLLSGIGPSHYLSSKGIPVAHDSPYVGRFMYDNPRNGISIVSPVPLDQSKIKVVGVSSPMTYIEAVSNIVPVIASPGSPPVELSVATIVAKIGGPVSSGSLRLASRDVRKNPIVKFNYFSSKTDLHRCVNNTRKLADLLSSPSLSDYKVNYTGSSVDDTNGFIYFGEAFPSVYELSDTGEIERFCRSTAGTMWHFHGGCLVGRVVDEKLKVIGVDSLRVVDASLFRVAPGTNPQASLMMFGRYVGLQMLNQRITTSSA